MKTNFFTRYILTEDKKSHFLFLSKMSDQMFSVIDNSFNNRNSIGKHSNSEIRQLVKESNLSPDFIIDALTAFRVAIRFFNRLSIKNKVEDLLDDLVELCSIPESEIASFRSKVLTIIKLEGKFGNFIREEEVKTDVLPILKSLNGTVIYKPVFEERFDYDEIDIKDYKPRLIKQTASLLLELRNTDGATFYVQFGPTEFEQFLNELISFQIELKTIENDRH